VTNLALTGWGCYTQRIQIIEKTDLPATLSVDFVGEYSKVRVFTEEGTSRQVHVA
jgi:hypothetical protein